MDTLDPAITKDIILRFSQGEQPTTILKYLLSLGLERETADYIRESLSLSPEVVSYIYAWLRGSISDERLDMWIMEMINSS